jgi:hypothetical protein
MTDQPQPEDTCRAVDIDGETIRVRGAAELTDEGREALAALVGAARRKMEAEPPPIRQQLQAVAFNAVLPALEKHREWLRLTARRTIANAVLEAIEGQLDIGEVEAWCKTCRRVWDGPRHQCESDAEQQLARVRAARDRIANSVGMDAIYCLDLLDEALGISAPAATEATHRARTSEAQMEREIAGRIAITDVACGEEPS